jgi:hypothetical protein
MSEFFGEIIQFPRPWIKPSDRAWNIDPDIDWDADQGVVRGAIGFMQLELGELRQRFAHVSAEDADILRDGFRITRGRFLALAAVLQEAERRLNSCPTIVGGSHG